MAGLLWYRSYMDSLANTNGYYPDIHAGHADRVAELTLKAPYLIREVPSGYNQLELSQIIGGTMVVEGSLQSVEATAHVTVGFNQWDGTSENSKWISSYTTGEVTSANASYNVTGYIPVVPSTQYYMFATGSSRNIFYDVNKNAIPMSSWEISDMAKVITTPSNAYYVRFTIMNQYLSSFCFNLSDPDKNGTYEPYTADTTPLANITLRGISTTVDGVLSYDGDTYDPDGTVTRYYGERSYQAGDESLPDTVTDGTNTVYKLTTPVTESAAPYTATQTVEEGGTAQFVTSNSVPVGNVSIYRRV